MQEIVKPRNPLLLTARKMAMVKMNDWNYFTIAKAQLKEDMGAVKEWVEYLRRLESTERHIIEGLLKSAEEEMEQGRNITQGDYLRDLHFHRGRAEGYGEAAAFLEKVLANCWEAT